MKTILCFGDSNTWGYSPIDGQRLNENERWPALLTKKLPVGYQVIEQGLPGRTTLFDDLDAGFSNGKEPLITCLENHQPDYILLMLGSNDLKNSFAQSASDIAQNAAKLVSVIQQVNSNKRVKICLIAPPSIHEIGYFGQLFAGGAEKSKTLAKHYALYAAKLGCEFFDAGSVVKSSLIDGLHWEVDQHKKMADAVSIKLREFITPAN